MLSTTSSNSFAALAQLFLCRASSAWVKVLRTGSAVVAAMRRPSYRFFSSIRICFATDFRVSNTPRPVVATASKVGSRL